MAVSAFRRSARPAGSRPPPRPAPGRGSGHMAVSPFRRFAVPAAPVVRPRSPAPLTVVSRHSRFGVSALRPTGGLVPTRPDPRRGGARHMAVSPFRRFAVSAPRFRRFAVSPFPRTRWFASLTARGTDYLAICMPDMRRFAVSGRFRPFRPRAGGLVPHPTRAGAGLAISWPFRRFAVSPSRPSHITSVWRHACAA